MDDKDFVLAGDGWVQLTPCGEYPHKGAGVTQVIDREACAAMVTDFNARKAAENFPGVLVDFDHFSLDTDKPSEAAGWISDLEARDDGLWARVRWSDAGLSAVTGGRYRLLSPVFRHPGGTEDLGEGRVRPVVLESVALTNEPNIKGGRPIANRGTEDGGRTAEDSGEGSRKDAKAQSGQGQNGEPVGDVMSGPGAKRFMWLLGNPEKGPHCQDCLDRHGMVKTLLEWMRVPAPKCRCCCTLAEVGVDVAEDYVAPAIMTPAEDGEDLENRWAKGWGDEARAASLASRRAKAAARAATGKWEDAALAMIRTFEGYRDKAYPDPATGGAPWTVGWGSTKRLDGTSVGKKDRVSREAADEKLAADVQDFAEGLSALLPWVALTDAQRAALVSWAYNVGLGNAGSSSLAKRLNAGEDAAKVIAEELPKWRKAAGKVMPGLERRRGAEVAMSAWPSLENRWAKPWGDKARAASLAVRQAKAAARKAAMPGGTYPDGQPVIRDLTDLPPPREGASISDAARFEASQASARRELGAIAERYSDVSGSIEGFNEVVGLLAGGTAAAGGRAPMGVASRAFGAGVRSSGAGQGRRSGGGAFSRITGNVRDWFNGKPGELPAYERAKAVFAQRRAVEKAALVEAVRKAKGVISEKEGKDLNGLNASILRGYLREIGGNPDEVAPRHRLVRTPPGGAEGQTGFEGLKAKYGVKPEEIKTPEKYAPKVPAAQVREDFADYLLETLGGRRGTVDQNLLELEAFRRDTSRAVARAKARIRDAQHTVSEAKRVNGEGSPEYAKALKAAEEAVWEHGHASRVNDEVSREYVQLRRNIDDYLRSVEAGNPFDWGPKDRDYNRLLDEARKSAGALGNRWKYGWGDAARAASLAVRKAKAAARKAAEGVGGFMSGESASGGKGDGVAGGDSAKSTACFVCGQEGHWARECPERAAREYRRDSAGKSAVKKPQVPRGPGGKPHVLGTGDLYVDSELTIPKGTSREDASAMLRRHGKGYFFEPHVLVDKDYNLVCFVEPDELAAPPRSAAPVPDSVLEKDLAVDAGLTILAGTTRKQAAAILERHKAGRFLDATISHDQRMRALGAEAGRRSLDNPKEGKSMKAKKKAKAAKARQGSVIITNRWAKPWGDKARAASLAVRRAKAAARAAAEGSTAPYVPEAGTYPDGTPVVKDTAGDVGSSFTVGIEPGTVTIRAEGSAMDALQAKYAAALREAVQGVADVSDRIEAFNAVVMMLAGVGGGAGAASRALSGTNYRIGRIGREQAVADKDGNITGWAKVGSPYGRSAAARRSTRARPASPSREALPKWTDNGPRRAPKPAPYDAGIVEGQRDFVERGPRPGPAGAPVSPSGSDPTMHPSYAGMAAVREGDAVLNDPQTPEEVAFRDSYANHLEEVRAEYAARMAVSGLDPMGFPLSVAENGVSYGAPSSDAAYERIFADAPAPVREAAAIYDRLGKVSPVSMREDAAYRDILDGLNRFRELYEADLLERAEKEGIVDWVKEALTVFDRPMSVRESEADAESSAQGLGLDMPYTAEPREFSRDIGEAAFSLGVLHGQYGMALPEGYPLPEELRGEYERGAAEGVRGYDYGVTVPKDRAAVLRAASAYVKEAEADSDYGPDHLNDRFNLDKWSSAATWATRNIGGKKGDVYDPDTPDTRAQYAPENLLKVALDWLGDAMARGDREQSDAALAYMADTMISLFGGRRAAVEPVGGVRDEEEDGEGAVEEDPAMPEYDEDGNEIGAESPFYEDSVADPNMPPPWKARADARRKAYLGNRALSDAGKAARAAGLVKRVGRPVAEVLANHTAACAAAKSPAAECTCSCGGAMHGGRTAGLTITAKPVLFGGAWKRPAAEVEKQMNDSPKTEAEWMSLAIDKFFEKFGRDPEDMHDWSVAEALAQVPPALRTAPIEEDAAAGIGAGGGAIGGGAAGGAGGAVGGGGGGGGKKKAANPAKVAAAQKKARERAARHRKNEERKEAAKAALAVKREEARNARNASIADKFAAISTPGQVEASGLKKKFLDTAARVADEKDARSATAAAAFRRLADKPLRTFTVEHNGKTRGEWASAAVTAFKKANGGEEPKTDEDYRAGENLAGVPESARNTAVASRLVAAAVAKARQDRQNAAAKLKKEGPFMVGVGDNSNAFLRRRG